ncbi:nitrilase-related carbon-nitrogen hydrolase [Lentzea aerocolonigenes]|uniref:nitrilase-related carbon-nitrogen hydrolase n=1 Tax=Lentzea aerocolonigenes TaxID=68170 RepID=UPI002ED1E7FD
MVHRDGAGQQDGAGLEQAQFAQLVHPVLRGEQLGEGAFGLATCYDVRFPELFRALADTAPVILLGASWGAGPGKADQWDLLTRARALDATSWVLACGQADPDADHGSAPTGIGRSAVIDPLGTVRRQLDGAPGTILSDVDIPLVDEARAMLPVLANRRL